MQDNKRGNLIYKSIKYLMLSTVNVVHDGSNLVCVSCGKDVFMISHDKCVARYALSSNSKVKGTLFTSHVATKSSMLGDTHVVAKYRFSVDTPPKATDKVSRASPLTPESRQTQTLNTYMKNKIKTSSKWQKWFEHQSCFNWSPKSSNSKTPLHVSKSSVSHRTNSKTPVTTQKWVAKLSTLPSEFVSHNAVRFGNDNFVTITRYGDYVQGNLTICHVYYVKGLGHNIFSVGQFCDGDLEVAFRSNTCFVRNLEGEDLLIGFCASNLYTISISEMAASSPIQRNMKAQVLKIQSDNGTEFKNATLKSYYEKLGILHHTSIARTPQQNGFVERRNRTLVEAARTMLIFSKLPEFLWAEAISTACFTQNCSIVHTRYNKTPYELIKGRNPNV
ncbi:integrase, catalytic region, zinc finger, CCHC-type containing protein [Tanacetum coccineum]